MTELERKEQWSIDFLRTIEAHTPDLYLAYSGGKDSDVLLHIARKAKIPLTAYYTNTTIDPPHTIPHVKAQNIVTIINPPRSFYTLIEHRGLPSSFRRFCCTLIKERFVAENIITGIRRWESKRRAQKYKEPIICFEHKSGRKGQRFMPILDWTDENMKDYIAAEQIQCHPLYYDNTGRFCVERRLGCLGCPLPTNRSIEDFKRYPKLVKAWCRAAAVYRNSRKTLGTSITNYRDEYEYFYHNLFNYRIAQLFAQQREEPRNFARERLQQFFQIELPPPKSALEDLMPIRNF